MTDFENGNLEKGSLRNRSLPEYEFRITKPCKESIQKIGAFEIDYFENWSFGKKVT